jgi:hypothetical protein
LSSSAAAGGGLTLRHEGHTFEPVRGWALGADGLASLRARWAAALGCQPDATDLQQYFGRPVSAAELGCLASHHQAWREALAAGAPLGVAPLRVVPSSVEPMRVEPASAMPTSALPTSAMVPLGEGKPSTLLQSSLPRSARIAPERWDVLRGLWAKRAAWNSRRGWCVGVKGAWVAYRCGLVDCALAPAAPPSPR